MSLPAQLQKQSDDVKDLYRQLAGEEPDPVDTVEPVVPVLEQSPEKPVVIAADNQNDQTFAQKYRTLQGMYNSEVPKLHSQLRDTNGRIAQLEQLLSSMQAPQQQSLAPQQTQHQKLITDQDVEEYGDSIGVMRKAAREEMAAQQQRIDYLESIIGQMQPLGQRVEQLAQSQAVSAEQRFWTDLSQSVPNWQSVNTDPDFQSWLLATDPLTGNTRQYYLENAQRNLDVSRVTAFFNEWANVSGSGNQPQPQSQPQSPQSQSPTDKRAAELAKQVVPGKARTSNPHSAQNTTTYSSNDIKQFYVDVSQGKFRGREEAKRALESDIFAAQTEGRIVG